MATSLELSGAGAAAFLSALHKISDPWCWVGMGRADCLFLQIDGTNTEVFMTLRQAGLFTISVPYNFELAQ